MADVLKPNQQNNFSYNNYASNQGSYINQQSQPHVEKQNETINHTVTASSENNSENSGSDNKDIYEANYTDDSSSDEEEYDPTFYKELAKKELADEENGIPTKWITEKEFDAAWRMGELQADVEIMQKSLEKSNEDNKQLNEDNKLLLQAVRQQMTTQFNNVVKKSPLDKELAKTKAEVLEGWKEQYANDAAKQIRIQTIFNRLVKTSSRLFGTANVHKNVHVKVGKKTKIAVTGLKVLGKVPVIGKVFNAAKAITKTLGVKNMEKLYDTVFKLMPALNQQKYKQLIALEVMAHIKNTLQGDDKNTKKFFKDLFSNNSKPFETFVEQSHDVFRIILAKKCDHLVNTQIEGNKSAKTIDFWKVVKDNGGIHKVIRDGWAELHDAKLQNAKKSGFFSRFRKKKAVVI